MLDPRTQIIRYRRHAWHRNLGNFALIKHRACDGHLLSMHQSGTHWLKYMLANALSHQYGTPPPQYNHANDIIGGPKDPLRYPQLPRLISSHSIPHPLLRSRSVHRMLALPPYLLLIRDIRATLVSNYVKWRDTYRTDFSEYLLGDPLGRRYNSDIWWALRFLNAWGKVRRKVPERVGIVRYEDLERDPIGQLSRAAAAFGLELSHDAVEHGVAVSSKAHMAAKDDPERPSGTVRADDTDPLAAFEVEDRRVFERICAQFLGDDFGYDYTTW